MYMCVHMIGLVKYLKVLGLLQLVVTSSHADTKRL